MTTIAYVAGAARMITAAQLTPEGLFVRFADELEGVIPFAELSLPDVPRRVAVPQPHVLELHLRDGSTEEVPWDFARHFADPGYRRRSEEAEERGRRLFGERLRALRSAKEVTQQQLAEGAGVSRVTIARIEAGRQLPRYGTLAALAEALNVPIERLLGG